MQLTEKPIPSHWGKNFWDGWFNFTLLEEGYYWQKESFAYGEIALWKGILEHHCPLIHDSALSQFGNHLGRRIPLADGAVNTYDPRLLLIDQGVQDDGGLARLPVPQDQLPWPRPMGTRASTTFKPVCSGTADDALFDPDLVSDISYHHLTGRGRCPYVRAGNQDKPDSRLSSPSVASGRSQWNRRC